MGLVAWLALALAAGCGSKNDSSQVDGSSASSNGASAGTVNIIVPTGDGGSGNGSSSGGAGSMPGPYMLPTGFTPQMFGGYMTGPALTDANGSAGAGSGGDSSSGCGSQILAVVRDFKGINEPNGHPDFEHFAGGDASVGIVKADLGSDQKPVYAQADGGPFIDKAEPIPGSNPPMMDDANGQQTTDKAHYDQWYRNTADVNKPYIVYLYFQPNGNVLTFESTAFFPIDNVGWGNTCHEPDAMPKSCMPQDHNFGFTTEVHTRFTYKGGETFAFTGDDDLWVFINNKLAIDLGGLHPKTSKSISLDAEAASLGITKGQTYSLDLFHAERHTTASNFRVDTNLEFTNCGTIVPDVPVK